MYKITLFEGDGIGPEITKSVIAVTKALKINIEWDKQLIGQTAYEKTGSLIPQETIDSFKKNKISLKGPVTTPIGKGFRSVNVQLRKEFDLYSNIRPAVSLPNTLSKFANVDLVIFRENTEGLYMGIEHKIGDDAAESIKLTTRKATERIVKAAFKYAVENNREQVTCVHKANILKFTDGLFLEIFNELKENYPQIKSNDLIVDNACMQLVMYPEKYDVMVMSNLYGDILSDLSSGLIGGLGLLPGANIGDGYAMFEAVHGSAPDIAGKNIANPTAILLSLALMLEYLGEKESAKILREAIQKTMYESEYLTADLGGLGTTVEFTNAIIKNLF